MNKSMLIIFTAMLASNLASIQAQAAILVSGETVALSGTTAAAQPELAGTIVNDNILFDSVAPSGNDFFVVGVDAQNRVVESNTEETLIFAPRIISVFNNTGGNFLIDSVVLDGFSDFLLDVDYRTDGLGDKGPNMASRSVSGDILTFDFLFPLVVSNLAGNPQEDSYFFSIKTNATAFSNTGNMRIFGRHLDYPGETFALNYTGIAVPIIAPVSASTPSVFMIFLLIAGWLATSPRALNRQCE